MRPKSSTSIATWVLLVGAGGISFMLPDTLTVPASYGGLPTPPDTIFLTGLVRDFQMSHPDFHVGPSGSWGHDAGIVDLTISTVDEVPVYAGGGYRVDTQWLNRLDEPLAPHLWMTPPRGEMIVRELPRLGDGAVLDAYDPAEGLANGYNVYEVDFRIDAPMPLIPPAPDLGPSTGDLLVKRERWLSQDLRVSKLTISDTLWIDGNVTVICDGVFSLGSKARLELTKGSTLNLYLHDGGDIAPGANVNNIRKDPSLVNIYVVGTVGFKLNMPKAITYANVISPDAPLRVQPNSTFYGFFAGHSLDINGGAAFHFAGLTSTRDQCDSVIHDLLGTGSGTSNSNISSAVTFNDWFRDVAGTTLLKPHVIALVDNGAGIYEYYEPQFFPIDGELFGNEGGSHNTAFTYAIEGEFTYDACKGQFYELQGEDDIWVFIDGKLVIDLGGLQADQRQTIRLDRLGLTDGQSYSFHLFYAQRNSSGRSTFGIRTNVLTTSTARVLPAVTAAFD